MSAADLVAGPIVRRVGTDLVSVWIALAVPADVTLSIYAHAQVAGAERTPLAETTVRATRLGTKLFCALPTIELAAGAHLEPGLIYDYDLAFAEPGTGAAQGLGALGLLEEGTINGHRHLPLGYVPGLLPSFVVAPRKAAELVIAHGSCRRPYAEGLDAIVALDQVIARGREGPPAGPRPHYLFFTGDQIYADDLSVEMLGWVNEVGVEIIGTQGGHAIERLRVELPDKTFARTVRFPADAAHFPPGRRQRLGTRAAALTSQDNNNHALSFGEIAAHYLLSWCNVLWPQRLDDDATWKALYAERGDRVRDYLAAWRTSHANARAAWKQHRAANSRYAIPKAAYVDHRVPYLDAWKLLPKVSRALDQFATAAPADWAGSAPAWQAFWTAVGATAPEPDPPATIAAGAGVPASAFLGSPTDLAELAALMTPAWYAGKHHTSLSFDYDVDAANDPPASDGDLELTGDGVLTRLGHLRTCYVALPYVRRALANVSTLMMFDDHEVTDDWTVTQAWLDGVRARALGRDVMTNGLAAYLVFQDWGNDPKRYRDDHPNGKALAAIGRMFVDGDNPRADGPPQEVRAELERLFGFHEVTATQPEVPLAERATWSFSVNAPDIAPYEIVVLDNRTQRGYDRPDEPPANLSIQSLAMQLPATPPAGSEVTIVVASLPVLGYPPTEEIAQPIGNLVDGIRKSRDLTDPGHQQQTFPQVELDYLFGTLIKDPEAWAFNTRAQEALFERLASRAAVVILSGDIHYSLTGKVTYFRQTETGLVAVSRFAQLISSALKNEPGGAKAAYAQLGIVEQLGALIAGPYDRLGWATGGVDGPRFDLTGASYQLALKLRMNPAIVPVRMLPTAVRDQLQARTLAPPPQWAWRFDVVKDLRPDAERYAALASSAGEWLLPTEEELAADQTAAIQRIANHHAWHGRYGLPRRTFFYANVGLVQFERTVASDDSSPLVVVHSLYAWDRMERGPGGGALVPNVPWPDARLPAQPYTQYRVSFDLTDELPPDRPDPTEEPS